MNAADILDALRKCKINHVPEPLPPAWSSKTLPTAQRHTQSSNKDK